MNISRAHLIILIILLSSTFLMRFINISFPYLTSDEARVAYRSYTLATTSKDELGRKMPFLFNSSHDYQLPLVSYLATLGILIFGKSDLGVRMPFLILGTVLIFFIFQIAKVYSNKPLVWFLASFIAALSPPLIFLSKVPNEIIVIVTFFSILFYFLTRKKINYLVICLLSLALILTSKNSWFILTPFVSLTLYLYQNTLSLRKKLTLILFSFIISITIFGFFLTIPQAKRSLSENNFPLFADVTTANGIDKLRGQGIDSKLPPTLERLFFNKAQIGIIGTVHWLSNLGPATYFGDFEKTGEKNFVGLGIFPKILMIPFLLGTILLIKRWSKNESSLLLYPFLLTFPGIFIFPSSDFELAVLTVPFLAIVITFGFLYFGKRVTSVLALFVILEVLVNYFFLDVQIRKTQEIRPNWVKSIVNDIYTNSQTDKVIVSDDITKNIVPQIEWYNLVHPESNFSGIDFPYKFNETNIGRVKLVGFDSSFFRCANNLNVVFVSNRDLERLSGEYSFNILKTYKDTMGKKIAYVLSGNICLK